MSNTSQVITRLMECMALKSPTPPGDVAEVANWIEVWGTEFGAIIERQTVEPGKDNLLMTLEFGPGPTLVFNSHMDVNNPNGQKWSNPPFEPRIIGNRLYGVGACDAKGSLVSMLAAMERLARDQSELCGKLVLTAVMGEEAGGIGSLHLVNEGIEADGAVVGEPTQLEVCTAHKGTYMRRLGFRGLESHSGRPDLGVNSIVHAAHFVLEYEKLKKQLIKQPHPLLGPASAEVTIIRGGTRQNTIPGYTEMIIDRRLLPGETHAKADGELETVLANTKKAVPSLQVENIDILVATIPSETHSSERIVEIALDAVSHVMKSVNQPKGFPAGCDMSKLVTIANIPTVIIGPGSLTQAHAPDEFVEIVQVEQAVDVYENIARRFLKKVSK
ncbi:M20 family metallopeptidase [Bacillus sp. REN16]|uniref:M20 family metallopeptidase n=1 Tax=Bacillus sp. REN16 TaxID=2887296 RepID=UPI001E63E7CE|nr:M20 family metallopeptidase [Bacillus sp. REN16]MCC3356780.1 M20 family metallopeptidase [Bacillus sp. REN16]